MQELITVASIDSGMALNNNLVCSALIMAGLSIVEKRLFDSDKNNEINPYTYIIVNKCRSGAVTRQQEGMLIYIIAIAV